MTKEEDRALLQRWREQGAGAEPALVAEAEQILAMSRRLSSDELRALDGLPPRAVSVAQRRVGPYVLHEALGRDGMGVGWRATHTGTRGTTDVDLDAVVSDDRYADLLDALEAAGCSFDRGELGFDVPPPPPAPEHRLYDHLAQREGQNAYAAYNVLIRRLVSFERAMEAHRTAAG